MNRLALSLAFLAALGAAPAHAALITVADVGSILDQSVALPAEKTPGAGAAFDEFFEFTLPVAELVTVSMSDSATGAQRITGGLLSLNNWTSSSATPPFAPLGALIESSGIANFAGGQSATVTPDRLAAGAYFAEISGVSGLSPLRIAVDGTATATVPEPSTWAMLLIGAAAMAWGALTRRRVRTLLEEADGA